MHSCIGNGRLGANSQVESTHMSFLWSIEHNPATSKAHVYMGSDKSMRVARSYRPRHPIAASAGIAIATMIGIAIVPIVDALIKTLGN